MKTTDQKSPPDSLTENEIKIIVEQYKILTESLNNTNVIRESSNNFWMAVNGLCLSGIAYIKDSHMTSSEHKYLFMYTLIFIGTFLCLFWINFLFTIKKTIQVRNSLVIELEKYSPIKVFTRVFSLTQQKTGAASLTLREIFIPILFLIGYLLFGFMLYFFTEEIITPSKM